MGKSDPFIIDFYQEIFDRVSPVYKSVAILGALRDNEFTAKIHAPTKHFFDKFAVEPAVQWDINSEWDLGESYDLIVSTRCPYFAKNPREFIDRCLAHLNPGGHLFIDWGLGDHWRCPTYRVGWVSDNVREFAYAPDNFLHSVYWRKEFEEEHDVKLFSHAIKEKGYDESLTSIVNREVPSVCSDELPLVALGFKVLWPSEPQLYIVMMMRKE